MIGKLLFLLQVLAMAFCFFPLSLKLPTTLTLFFIIPTLVLVFWVLVYNKLGNWSVLPSPKKDARLIITGPYGFMRHPMYTSVILGNLAMVLHNQSIYAFFSWIALLIVLNIKARYEERLLLATFDDYGKYLASVKNRFVPSLF
jgi:protein-S-isoprenylcysteine O-methyltransferase Ste14